VRRNISFCRPSHASLKQPCNGKNKYIFKTFFKEIVRHVKAKPRPGNTKGNTVPLISCLTGMESAVFFLFFDGISCMTTDNFCFIFAKQTNPNHSNRKPV
jgi:hypothetical protein